MLEYYSPVAKLRSSISGAAVPLHIPSGSHWEELKLLLIWCGSLGLIAPGTKGHPRLLGDCDLDTLLTSFKHSLLLLIFLHVIITRKYLKLAEKGK